MSGRRYAHASLLMIALLTTDPVKCTAAVVPGPPDLGLDPATCVDRIVRAGPALATPDYSRFAAAPVPELVGGWSMSSSSIEEFINSGQLHQLSPPLDPTQARLLLSPGGILGHGGMLGPASPISELGPDGSLLINPSYLISGSNWQHWARKLTALGGALSENGALFDKGPTSELARRVLERMGPAGVHLGPGGILSFVGTHSELGDRGRISPVSPIGATGLRRDEVTGLFYNAKGEEIRSVTLDYKGKKIDVPLWEELTPKGEERIMRRTHHLDSSFGVTESLGTKKAHEFHVRTRGNSVVSYTVHGAPLIPTFPTPNFYQGFELEARTLDGTLIARSTSSKLVNTIEIMAPQAIDIVVSVRYGASFLPENPFLPLPRTYTFNAVEYPVSDNTPAATGPYLTRYQ